jgi:hypothetical protein
VRIGVGANVGGVDAAIQKITQSMNKLGAAVSANQKLRFEPTDVKLMARDLSLINKQFQQTLALSAQLRSALKATGQTGSHLSQIDFSKLSADPRVAQRMRDRAFLHSVRGTALDPTAYNEVDSNGNIVPPAHPGGGGAGGGSGGSGGSGGGGGRRPGNGGSGGAGGGAGGTGGGSWWSRRPNNGWGTATALAVGNGIGGTAGNMITAGMGGGGLPGMGLALLTSVIGKGMEWAGQGMDQGKARNLDLDALKRSLGDLGVSFGDLSDQSWKFAHGLGIVNGEFVKLEAQANAASGGAYRTPEELARATRSGADLARAYGLDPSQGVGFVSGMQRIDSHQNNKELATQLAEAIVNAQGKATPGEVMQAMQSFASAQNQFNAVNPNLNVFGNAFGSMLTGDMTADHASGILGQANSSMQRMGGTEASKNFLLQQFGLDPIRAQLRSEGGLFANGLDNQDVSTFMHRRGIGNWDDQSKGPAGSNLAVTMQGLDRAYAGRGQYGYEMELDAVKNMFGLKSLGDAASLANASTSDHNGIAMVLKNAGVNLSDVREGGLQAISGISKAGDFDSLDKMYRSSIRGRPDMRPEDIAAMDKAEGSNNFQQFQNELVRVLSGKGQEDTQATIQRNIDTTLTDIKTVVAGPLLTAVQGIEQDFIKVLGFFGIGAPSAATSGGSAPYGYGSGPASVGGNKGIVVQPGGSPSARGGSTRGGAGNARDMSGHVDNSGDWWAKQVNETYGAAIGGAYSVNSGVVDGMGQIMGSGVDKAHASAIMASAIRESSMNPGARNGNMYGLFQFDKSRQADFQKVMGKSIIGSSASDQIDYMLRSMRKGGEEAGPGAAFFASSGKDAARVFSSRIERTDHASKEGDIRSGIASSLNDSNIHITLNQTVTTPGGATKMKTLSTKVAKPAATGLQTPTIIQLPG